MTKKFPEEENMKTLVLNTTLAAIAAATISAARAETANSYLPPTYPQSVHGYTETFDRVRERSKGELDFETYFSGALLPAATTLTGIRDGVAEVGLVYPSYTPAELPISDFLNSVSFLNEDALAAAIAYTELNFTLPSLQAEWGKYNTVFGGAFATPVYRLMCNQPVTTLAQANGKSMRTASAGYTAFAGSVGGTAVSVPIGDAYSGLQRGSLDCLLADPTNMTTASLNEVVKNVTLVTLGTGMGATWVYNKDYWSGLSPENRALLLEEMMKGMVDQQLKFAAMEAESLDEARGRGTVVEEPAADLAAHVTEFKAHWAKQLVGQSSAIGDPQAILDTYIAAQQRWIDLLNGVDRSDPAAVLALVNEHLLSKIDPANYGM